MAGRFVGIPDNSVSILSFVSGREVSSETPGPPTAPAQTLLVFPDHKPQSSLTFHDGSVASGIPVQLLFWGDYWDKAGAGQREELIAKVTELLSGPYFEALDQYGVAKPVYRGAITVTQPDPPSGEFDGSDVGSLVWDLIDNGVFPSPSDQGGFNAYHAFVPSGASLAENADGAHGARHPTWWEFWTDTVLVSWSVWHPDADSIIATFAHELVELVTDPDHGGWYNDDLGHKDGEVADLCEPHHWQSAYVGNVKVRPYWSARDQACVIPTHPLKVRVDGRISVDAVHEDGHGEKEYPFGEGGRLCALLPSCCFKGPYKWTSSRVDETASVQATVSGFHAATINWQIAGKPVSGNGSLDVSTTVTRQTDSGPTSDDQMVTLRYEQAGDSLWVTNDSAAGSFDVVLTAVADEGGVSASGGTTVQGARRVAHCVLPFQGQIFTWDNRLDKDRAACDRESDALWKKTHKAVQKKIGPLDPGELRPHDRAVLSSAGAGVQEGVLVAARAALARAAVLEVSHPKEAKELRQALLASLGIPSR